MTRGMLALPCAGAVCLCLIVPHPARATDLGGDACSRLTASQVSGVLGVTVEEGVHPIASSLLLCSWLEKTKSRSASEKVSISLMTERGFDVGKTPIADVVVTPLGGVGDEAYYTAARSLGTRLSVKNAGVCIQIRLEGLAPAKTRALERALALEMLMTH